MGISVPVNLSENKDKEKYSAFSFNSVIGGLIWGIYHSYLKSEKNK